MHITADTEHMLGNEFAACFNEAAPGEIIVYAIGRVATSLCDGKWEPYWGELKLTAKMALKLQDAGYAQLSQKRMSYDYNMGIGVYAYRCEKTRKANGYRAKA
jgi:hypothetical protein